MIRQREIERVGTIVIGGGQAGLAVGYHLARKGLPFLILDASERIGDAWRSRWDSLRLFTPARYDGLPGWGFPTRGDGFPSKDQMADYLEAYAKRFSLPVRSGVEVDHLSKEGDRFVLRAGPRRYEADQVVVAMGEEQRPVLPEFVRDLDPEIVQMHSSDYKNPSQLKAGPALIVGVGNSGADIGLEVARSHRTLLSGKESGQVPFRIESFLGRHLFMRLMRFLGHRILTVNTPVGRRARPKLLARSAPLIRVKPEDLLAAGIERVPRVVAARNGYPLLEDGRVLEVSNVIWCTGYHAGFSWIDLPVFGSDGRPMHEGGVVAAEPGLYFVGLLFLYSMTSQTVGGVGRDAERIVRTIAERTNTLRVA